MIAKQTIRILSNFGRLVRPKLSQYENVFDIMRERTSSQLRFIEQTNANLFSRTKSASPTKILAEQLDIAEKTAEEVSQTTIQAKAYSPITNMAYRITQAINGDVQLVDSFNSQETPYKTGHNNLKYHYSINSDVPTLMEYSINKSSAYIFNLPDGATEKQLLMELGMRLIKNIKIHYCMLGLPAYATVQFISENHLTEKIISNKLEVTLQGKSCKIVTQADAHTLPLNRRQLVIKDLPSTQTPAAILSSLSQYGRVMHLNVPMEVYRQPSIASVKKEYQNQKYPIKINYHRKNGTIQSEFFPPFQSTTLQKDAVQQRQQQYKRRLRYCQNVDVYEGQQNQVKIRAKGFCIVTFSCQQQAQNCYLQLNLTHKMELLNGRQQFQFDQRHRQALLRFIDNSFIDKQIQSGPTKQYEKSQQTRKSFIGRSIYMTMMLEDFKNFSDGVYLQSVLGQNTDRPDLELHHMYKTFLNQMKQTVGKGNYDRRDPLAQGNLYGKSFDELAQEQLYGMKLKQRKSQPRYEVDIDSFIHETMDTAVIKPKMKRAHFPQYIRRQDDTHAQKYLQMGQAQNDQADEQQQKRLEKQQQKQQLIKQKTNKVNKSFSTIRDQFKQYRPKSLKEKVSSHMNYNRFVRDTLNQYMGIFPMQKLQAQFNKKKPTFVNPQNLKFEDGSDFVKQEELGNILEFANKKGQALYDSIVKQNEIFKSLNLDVEEKLLRNFAMNASQSLYYYSDIGVIKEQFKFQGQDIEETKQQLNVEAELGQEYRVVKNEDGSNSIVKIAKLQSIAPLDLIAKCENDIKSAQSQGLSQRQLQISAKYRQYFLSGEPIPLQLAEIIGLKKGQIINAQQMLQQVCSTFNLRKKDIQKIMNIENYNTKNIQDDIRTQLQLGKARERRAERKASDYSKDPSDIKARDKNKKAVVSKFRQM